MKTLYVVGIGPGNTKFLTAQARAALDAADLFCGYGVYTDLLKEEWPHTAVFTTPMTRELERCRMALEQADSGKTVAMVCSGDAGVYGMAGPVLQLAEQYPEVTVEIVPGLSAVLSGAAVLGAPLMHDFAVISLSDLLTPKETIEKRLLAAGEADFAVCLYNPSSRKRADYLQWACELLMRSRSPETRCGWVRNIGREGEQVWTGTLAQLALEKVDMFTTCFIGNSSTLQLGSRMVTPRGYEAKQ